MEVFGQRCVPAVLPPGKTQYSLHSSVGGPQGSVWTGAGNIVLPRFDPQTVETVVSRYTD
jgi:hypothetical protein